MKHFTYTEAYNGELAARDLSEKALAFYNGADDLHIYEVEEDGEKTYYFAIGQEINCDVQNS